MNLKQRIEKEIEQILKKSDLLKNENIRETIETPPDSSFGDLATNICFSLSKKLKKSPQEIAEQAISGIKTPENSVIRKIETKGGYINFFLNYEKVSEKLLEAILEEKEKYGSSDFGKGKKIMVEHTQPNTNKSQHIGHGRNTVLGDALVKLLRFCDYDVIAAAYWGDIGIQQVKSILAYKKWGQNKKPDKKPDHFIGDFYTKYYQEVKNDPNLENEAKEFLQKWEEDDRESYDLWRKITNWVIDGFMQTLNRMNVKFDIFLSESQFGKSCKKIPQKLLETGVAFKTEDGAIAIDLEKHNLGGMIIQRSDGTALYQTKDLDMAIYKIEKFNLDKSIYVVGAEQKLYFQQIFKILELAGYGKHDRFYHLYYGLVNLPEGKMSSRKGRVVLLDDTINKLVELVKKEIEKRNPNLNEKQKSELSEKIGIGALKYTLVKVSSEKDILFEWKKVIDFEGNTGPYLQYAHVRADKILQKAGGFKENFHSEQLTEEEKHLIKKLLEFPEVVVKSAKEYKPNLVANYAYDISETFNTFYHSCPVIQSKGDLKNFRLTLVKAFKVVLKNSLNLLGIETPEVM